MYQNVDILKIPFEHVEYYNLFKNILNKYIGYTW